MWKTRLQSYKNCWRRWKAPVTITPSPALPTPRAKEITLPCRGPIKAAGMLRKWRNNEAGMRCYRCRARWRVISFHQCLWGSQSKHAHARAQGCMLRHTQTVKLNIRAQGVTFWFSHPFLFVMYLQYTRVIFSCLPNGRWECRCLENYVSLVLSFNPLCTRDKRCTTASRGRV